MLTTYLPTHTISPFYMLSCSYLLDNVGDSTVQYSFQSNDCFLQRILPPMTSLLFLLLVHERERDRL